MTKREKENIKLNFLLDEYKSSIKRINDLDQTMINGLKTLITVLAGLVIGYYYLITLKIETLNQANIIDTQNGSIKEASKILCLYIGMTLTIANFIFLIIIQQKFIEIKKNESIIEYLNELTTFPENIYAIWMHLFKNSKSQNLDSLIYIIALMSGVFIFFGVISKPILFNNYIINIAIAVICGCVNLLIFKFLQKKMFSKYFDSDTKIL